MDSMAEPGAREPAPGDLRVVQQFLNSVDIEEGVEQLNTPAALGRWLHEHGLASSRLRLDQDDLERAVRFRELLRAMTLANNGGRMHPAKVTELNRELRRLRFEPGLDPRGALQFRTTGVGVDAALGRMVTIVHEAMLQSRWHRLKACARDVCHWVFYDHSRNRTGTWCSMSICGSRTKMLAYYRRHRRTVRRQGTPGRTHSR
jgi:predicted RNA-binding Zn ribbon-like protein